MRCAMARAMKLKLLPRIPKHKNKKPIINNGFKFYQRPGEGLCAEHRRYVLEYGMFKY